MLLFSTSTPQTIKTSKPFFKGLRKNIWSQGYFCASEAVGKLQRGRERELRSALNVEATFRRKNLQRWFAPGGRRHPWRDIIPLKGACSFLGMAFVGVWAVIPLSILRILQLLEMVEWNRGSRVLWAWTQNFPAWFATFLRFTKPLTQKKSTSHETIPQKVRNWSLKPPMISQVFLNRDGKPQATESLGLQGPWSEWSCEMLEEMTKKGTEMTKKGTKKWLRKTKIAC